MVLELFRLDGRVAVVTAASRGIGAAIAEAFAEAGADVAISARTKEDLDAVAGRIESHGVRAFVHAADLGTREAMSDYVDAVVSEFGRIDVVVNNAGNPGQGTIEGCGAGSFERTMAIHTFSALYALRHAFPHMRTAGYGRVVNMLSRGAEVPNPAAVSYGAAKAALHALTRSAAQDGKPHGILVNGMIPGPTNSAIWGVDRPELQDPAVTWPPARNLMTLPADGPTGKVFWNDAEYRLFHPDRNGGRGATDVPVMQRG